MTVARSVADVLTEHVTLEVESIDRMYCNLYVPPLQHVNGVVQFFRGHRGAPFASSALMDPISKTFVASIHRYCRDHDVPMVEFVKGQRKDDVAHEYLAGFTGEEGVLFVGWAQEKTRVFRTQKRRNPETGATYPWIVSATGVVNQFYVYAVDTDFGPFFIKFSSYFPYTAKPCINGNEYAKRVAAKAGIGFTALDNGFAACDEPRKLQRICDRLSPAKIDGLVRKWLRRLPHPFTAADRGAGYRYDISVLQAEFSLTQMLDRPATGRIFFEEVIRDNLDLGRPDRVGLVFNRRIVRKGRRKTPGPGCLPPGSPRACTSTTRAPRSSSTTSSTKPCILRRPSTTAATSASVSGCVTCPPCGRSASPPTDGCWPFNGRPRHVGVTRQWVNVLVTAQIACGHVIRRWLCPMPSPGPAAEEEALIRRWKLREFGWNRG